MLSIVSPFCQSHVCLGFTLEPRNRGEVKALFSIFSLTAPPPICWELTVTILKPLCPHFSLSELSWQMENLFVSVRAAQKFPNLVPTQFWLTMGQVSVSHPRDPLLKNSIEEISFFSGRKYRGNIVPNLQSSDPSPTSSATEPYLHRALEEGRKKEGG